MKKTESKASLKHTPSSDQISKSKQLKSKSKIGYLKLQSKVQKRPYKQLKNQQKHFEKQQRYLIECNKCGQLIDRDILNDHLKICNYQKQQASILSQLDQCHYCKRMLPKIIKDSHLKKCPEIAENRLNQKKSKLKTINSENKLGLLKIKKKSKTKQIIEHILDKQSKQKYKKKSRSKSKLLKSKLALSKEKVQKRRSQSKKMKVARDAKQSLKNSSSLKFQTFKKSKEKKNQLQNKNLIQRNIQSNRQNLSHRDNLTQRQNPTIRSNNINTNRREQRQSSMSPIVFLQNIQQFNLTGSLDQQLEALSNNFTNLIETVSTMVNSPLIANRRVFVYQANNFSEQQPQNILQNTTYPLSQQYSGLRTQQIQTIPVHIFNNNRTRTLSNIQQSTKSCSVCLLQFKNGDPLKTLYCAHTFHQQCIDKWLQMKSSCPICRESLR